MKNLVFILLLITLFSCDKSFKHQRFISNNSLDTITVVNPDFDSIHFILPGEKQMIYSFENLDRNQESEPCKWLGDTLNIKTINDSICHKATSIESNWTSTIKPVEDGKIQTCIFSVESNDF
jgi:hypothetical protein